MSRKPKNRSNTNTETPLTPAEPPAEDVKAEKPVTVQQTPNTAHEGLSGGRGGCYVLRDGKRTRI